MMKPGLSSLPPHAVRPRKAFTLIELLIVVATISVLGGIAVPVFLEAQTRTRVSRARADMRMVALGMETFFIDHGSYPKPDDQNGVVIPGASFAVDPYDSRVPSALTTPISYLDVRLSDPFVHTGSLENQSYLLYTKEYFVGAVGEEPYWQYLKDAIGPASVLQVEYVILSRGPDMDHEEPAGHTWPSGDNLGDPNGIALYDPTNGTVSNGDIIYMGAGIGYNDK